MDWTFIKEIFWAIISFLFRKKTKEQEAIKVKEEFNAQVDKETQEKIDATEKNLDTGGDDAILAEFDKRGMLNKPQNRNP
jgi:hypothetical protein